MTQWLQHKRWQRFDTSWRLKRWTPNFTVHPVRSNVASSACASSNEPSTCCSWIWLIFFSGRYRDVTNDAWNHPQITWCQPDVSLMSGWWRHLNLASCFISPPLIPQRRNSPVVFCRWGGFKVPVGREARVRGLPRLGMGTRWLSMSWGR